MKTKIKTKKQTHLIYETIDNRERKVSDAEADYLNALGFSSDFITHLTYGEFFGALDRLERNLSSALKGTAKAQVNAKIHRQIAQIKRKLKNLLEGFEQNELMRKVGAKMDGWSSLK